MRREDLPKEMRPESMFGKEPNEPVPVILTRAEWALVGLLVTEHARGMRDADWSGLVLEIADEIRESIK
jgi:hypothetical protein